MNLTPLPCSLWLIVPLPMQDVVHLAADAEDSGAVKIAWAVMQPGARMPEGGISIPVRVQVPAVQEGVPATEQLHYVELSEFADALRAMPLASGRGMVLMCPALRLRPAVRLLWWACPTALLAWICLLASDLTVLAPCVALL